MSLTTLFEWIEEDTLKAKEAFNLLRSYKAIQEIDLALQLPTTSCSVSIGINSLTILDGKEFFTLPKFILTRSTKSDDSQAQVILQTKIFCLQYFNNTKVSFILKTPKKFLEIRNSINEIIFFQNKGSTKSILLEKGIYSIKNDLELIFLKIC